MARAARTSSRFSSGRPYVHAADAEVRSEVDHGRPRRLERLAERARLAVRQREEHDVAAGQGVGVDRVVAAGAGLERRRPQGRVTRQQALQLEAPVPGGTGDARGAHGAGSGYGGVDRHHCA